jgi:Fic family protein
MDFKLETELSKVDIFKELDGLKKQIDELRPLPEDVEGRVMQKLRLDWNYHSNAIEGNRLNYGETVAFLMEGITAKGKPLKDHLDIRGHNEAINFLLSIVKDTRPLSEADIRSLHKMILVEPYTVKAKTEDGQPTTKRITLGEYKVLPNHVKTSTGEIHYYASPKETPIKMQELMSWYSEASTKKDIHPIVVAALFHHKFVEIHPFDDGNGRLSRILMNLITMRNDFPPVIIRNDDRQNYYALLSRADNGDVWPFIEYITERLQISLQLFLKAAKGENIEEDEDVDKEITLFQMELENRIVVKTKRTQTQVKFIISESIIPLIKKVANKISEFEAYFFSCKKILSIHYADGISEDISLSNYGIVPLIAVIKNSTKDFSGLYAIFEFRKFKENKNGFDVTVELNIQLKDLEYTISDYKEEIIYKSYHEILSTSEINSVTKVIVQDAIDLMKSNL